MTADWTALSQLRLGLACVGYCVNVGVSLAKIRCASCASKPGHSQKSFFIKLCRMRGRKQQNTRANNRATEVTVCVGGGGIGASKDKQILLAISSQANSSKTHGQNLHHRQLWDQHSGQRPYQKAYRVQFENSINNLSSHLFIR